MFIKVIFLYILPHKKNLMTIIEMQSDAIMTHL